VDAPPVRNVLLVRFGSLGDVVLACAAGQALAAQCPEVAITFLVKEEYAEIVRAQPWARIVWALPQGEERGAPALKGWRARVREAGFAAAVDLQTSPRSRALLAGQANVLRWNAARWQRRRWVSLRWTRPRRGRTGTAIPPCPGAGRSACTARRGR